MNMDYLNSISISDCALLIIDCQNDFLAEGAPLENPRGRAKLGNIVAARAWARENGIPVVYTQETHRRQKMDFGMETLRGDPEHCLEDSEGVQIVKELTPDPSEYVVIKRRYSGFYETDMDIILKGLKKSAIILAGVDTNVCVYSTALDAQFRGYKVIALSDCTAGTSEEIHNAFLQNINYILGEVLTLEEVKNIIQGAS